MAFFFEKLHQIRAEIRGLGYLNPRQFFRGCRFARFERLESIASLTEYQKATAKNLGVTFPLDYLMRGRVMGLRNAEGSILGGFALILEGPYRVLEQLPENLDISYSVPRKKMEKAMEITGLWLESSVQCQVTRVKLYLTLFFEMLKTGRKYLLYSYDTNSAHLAKYYQLTRPNVIYNGPVKCLPGMAKATEEIVEIGSVWALVYVFFCRPDFLFKKFFFRRRRPRPISKDYIPVSGGL